jgi:hypothetical protein
MGASVSRATWRSSARTVAGIGGASSTAPMGFNRCSGKALGEASSQTTPISRRPPNGTSTNVPGAGLGPSPRR